MTALPHACIVSDFPIVVAAARLMLDGQYRVTRLSWEEVGDRGMPDTDLALLDVTEVTAETVVELVSLLSIEVRILVFSLRRNEVDVYQLDAGGLRRLQSLPSLIALQ